MSHVDELHARLEAAIARGRDIEQRYAAILARRAEAQRADAAETEAVQRFVLGLVEIAQAVAARASTDAHITPAVRRCQECGVVGHEPLAHEPGCLAAKARALLATATPPATDATDATAQEGE